MATRKRGEQTALSPQVLIPIVIIVVVVIGLAIYFNTSGGLGSTEKAAGIQNCIAAYQDKTYGFTSVQQCQSLNLATAAMKQCDAWVVGDPLLCNSLTDRDLAWCTAKATKKPEACDTLPSNEVEYCKAFVTRNPGLCDSMTNELSRFNCMVTIRGDTGAVTSDVANLCGSEYA
jgi:hypothetical protein